MSIKVLIIETVKSIDNSVTSVLLPYALFTKFYILLTVHLDVILVNDQRAALFPNIFISCLYMFRATSAHHQEGQIVLIHHLV
jgi:hypothetical protein